MALRQEQVVFIGAALLLGGLGYKMYSSGSTRAPGRGGSKDAPEFESYVAPDVSIALSNSRSMPLDRELFHPPRDTRPLPLLPLVEPPPAPLAQLFPPSDPGPNAPSFGSLLRRQMTSTDMLDLFASELDGEFEDNSTANLLADLAAQSSEAHENETPAETKARLDGYRRKYDWIQRGVGNVIYGSITNENRYALRHDPDRKGEGLLFVEVDPNTGEARYNNVGALAISMPWSVKTDFGFADTVPNRLEDKRAAFRGEFGRVDFRAALALGHEAMGLRLEAQRALEIAAEMFQMCIDYDPKDLGSQLGAIACLEAGFKFEEALKGYRKLEEDFALRAEVHVRLAQLDERFLSFEKARAGYERAVELEPTSWQAHLAFGEFLLKRGESAGALKQLQLAQSSEPRSQEFVLSRVAIREALGDAAFAEGDLRAAAASYSSALAARAGSQRAMAGLLSVGLYGGKQADKQALVEETQGYELLLSRGLIAMADGAHVEARDLLMQAIEADPLNAHRPNAALSCLAYLTGNEGEALGFIEAALEVQPRDAYALYWRGRLLTDQGDFEQAKQSLLAALDVELDFEDALVGLGDVAFHMGDYADAVRFLGRALGLNAERSEVHALAGMNYLRMDNVPAAQAAFEQALSLQEDNAYASCGLAWSAYLDGDHTQARVLLSNLDDARRDHPEDDAYRVWAREQIVRIQDHAEKVEWSDSFNRQRLINEWFEREGAGPTISMYEGSVKIEGVFDKEGSTSIFREYTSSSFVSMSIEIWVDPGTTSRVGVFVARERTRRSEKTIDGQVLVGRHPDGSLQIRSISKGKQENTVDMQQPVETGRWVSFTIERDGDEESTFFTVSMDGIRLIEGLDVPTLKGANSVLLIGVNAEGKSGQKVKLLIDEGRVVYRDTTRR